MAQWGEPFTETHRYSIGSGEIFVERTFIYHYVTEPFKAAPGRGADCMATLAVRVGGDISPEDAAAVEQWIIGGSKAEEIPPVLRVAVNLEPKGEAKMGEKIQLGQTVKDSITGFVGKVTARCEYLSTSPRVIIEGIAEGRPVEMWIDEGRVEVQG